MSTVFLCTYYNNATMIANTVFCYFLKFSNYIATFIYFCPSSAQDEYIKGCYSPKLLRPTDVEEVSSTLTYEAIISCHSIGL